MRILWKRRMHLKHLQEENLKNIRSGSLNSADYFTKDLYILKVHEFWVLFRLRRPHLMEFKSLWNTVRVSQETLEIIFERKTERPFSMVFVWLVIFLKVIMAFLLKYTGLKFKLWIYKNFNFSFSILNFYRNVQINNGTKVNLLEIEWNQSEPSWTGPFSNEDIDGWLTISDPEIKSLRLTAENKMVSKDLNSIFITFDDWKRSFDIFV